MRYVDGLDYIVAGTGNFFGSTHVQPEVAKYITPFTIVGFSREDVGNVDRTLAKIRVSFGPSLSHPDHRLRNPQVSSFERSPRCHSRRLLDGRRKLLPTMRTTTDRIQNGRSPSTVTRCMMRSWGQ